MLYRWMGRFVLLASSILFMVASDPNEVKYGWPALGLLFLILDLTRISMLSVGLFLQVMAWVTASQWAMAGTMLLIYLLHIQSMKQHSIRFDAAGLRINFPWPHQVQWQAVEFIVLKDGLLTLEYKNGRVLQQPIEKDPALTEANFNEFCQQQCKS